MNGFLLIDKPAGITSHDVIDRLRRVTGIRKIGHAGTLDPFATGLLIVGIGAATKRLSAFSGLDKSYEAEAKLGAVSDTQDLTGRIVPTEHAAAPAESALRAVLASFTGETDQLPPMYSAKKVGGKKLYELARAGKEVARKPARITVHELRLLACELPRFSFFTRCSSGTYVRTLAHDIGAALGNGAYLERLRRTSIGSIVVSAASPLAAVDSGNWKDNLVSSLPA